MRIQVGNVKCTCVLGGKDNLLKFDPINKLRDYLKVRVEGYFHSPLYKKHQWDGYRHFISSKGEFMTGFLPYVVKFLMDNNVYVDLVDERGDLPKMQEEFDDYIGRIDGVDWFARDKYAYQVDMVKKLNHYEDMDGQKWYFPRGILDAATNAGKNSIAVLLMKNLVNPWPAVFTVSNQTIYDQAVDFFNQAFRDEGWKVGEVKSGKCAPSDKLTVCMVKTLKNRLEKEVNMKMWANKVKTVIVDESDEAGAKEYSTTLAQIPAGIRVHVSGTPLNNSKVNNMISIGLSGPVLAKISNKELIEKGVSQKPIVTMILNDMGIPPTSNYENEERDHIHLSAQRARMVCDLINEHSDKQILITFNEKVHGYFMYNMARELCKGNEMAIAHGETANRKQLIEDFKKGRINVLFASMILKRGANIPNIQVMVMAQGGKSITIVKQLSGRGTRNDGKSDTVLFFDFYDTGKYVAAHSRKRQDIYKKEGFEVITDYETYRNKPIQVK